MSRRESDRDDLLREATALVERCELSIPGHDEPIVVGFRRDGSASFYFGADPVYQFNTACELRRAYVGGIAYKAEHGRLIASRRERSETEVVMLRSELSQKETAALLATLQQHFAHLQAALASGSFALLRQVPAGGNPVLRIRDWLTALPPKIKIARVPKVR
jgi:hypothetical protein